MVLGNWLVVDTGGGGRGVGGTEGGFCIPKGLNPPILWGGVACGVGLGPGGPTRWEGCWELGVVGCCCDDGWLLLNCILPTPAGKLPKWLPTIPEKL